MQSLTQATTQALRWATSSNQAPTITPGPWDWTLQLSVAVVVAVCTLVGVLIVTVQKRTADRREQWWKRTQWALERVEGDSRKTAIALGVLSELVVSPLASKDERRMLGQIGMSFLGKYNPSTEDGANGQ